MDIAKQKNHKLLRSGFLIVVMLGGGVGLASLLYAMRQEPPRRNSPTPPPFVETMLVEPEDVVERFVGYGSAQPDRTVHLAAEVAATVIELVDHIEAGAIVTKGQALIRLDNREYRYLLRRAEALVAADQAVIDEVDVQAWSLEKLVKTADQELRVAREEKARVTGLFELGHAAKKEYDFANLAYQRARRVLQGYEMELSNIAPRRAGAVAAKDSHEADAELARLNIQRCEIVAPLQGTIESLTVEVGDHVTPGSVIATIIDRSHVEIPIEFPAGVYDRVHPGAPCRVECESMLRVSWVGQVARIAPSVDPQSRTFAAYVEVDNTRQEQLLIPGTFVRAEVRGPTYHGRLLVPRGAIRAARVLVAVDGVVRERGVTIERLIVDRALVGGSLRAGDRVILSHLDQLSDGSAVRTQALTSKNNRKSPFPEGPRSTDSEGLQPADNELKGPP